jgi:hypothetical protein
MVEKQFEDLKDKVHTNLIGASSCWFEKTKISEILSEKQTDVIIDAAAKVGGIHWPIILHINFLMETCKFKTTLLDSAISFR